MIKKGDQCITVCVGEAVPEETMSLVMDILNSFLNSHEIHDLEFPLIYQLERVDIHGHRMQQVVLAQQPLERIVFEVKHPVEAIIYAYLPRKKEC